MSNGEMSNGGTLALLFVQTNESENSVIAFRRHADGTLAGPSAYPTGGAGSGTPHLPSQGSVVLTADGGHLLVTNAASNDLSLFAVEDDGLSLQLTIATGDDTPRSVAERDGLVYVLNTGGPTIVGSATPAPNAATDASQQHSVRRRSLAARNHHARTTARTAQPRITMLV